MSDERDPERERAGRPMRRQSGRADEDDDPPTGEPVAPMRLRPEPPRVTACRAKCWPASDLVASLGVGGR